MSDLNISQIQSLTGQLKQVSSYLKEPNKLNQRAVLELSSSLEDLQEKAIKISTSANPFISSAASSLNCEAQQLFSRIEEIKQARSLEDDKEEIYDLLIKVDELADRYFDLMPLEIGYFLDQSKTQLNSVLEKTVYSPILSGRVKEIEEKLNYISFRSDFPIIEELYDEAPFPTFAHRLLNEIERIRVSNPQKALKLNEKLESLKALAKLSFAFINKEISEAVKDFEGIPHNSREQIDQNIWRLTGNNFNNLKTNLNPDKKLAIAASIMAYIANEIY